MKILTKGLASVKGKLANAICIYAKASLVIFSELLLRKRRQ